MNDRNQPLAERVRSACVQAALEAYEHAGLSGLCAEGRWEYTIGVLREMDLAPLLAQPTDEAPEQGGARADGD